MNLDVYKKANGRWQATGIPQSLDLEALAACPFCGNRTTLSAQNFHTAEYWIECRICSTNKRAVGGVS
jgi:hypothetical protein